MNNRFKISSLLMMCVIAVPSASQPGPGLEQCLLDLSNDAVVMNISAHPDDEDGSTLAYYRKKYGVKTHSILFTRGEGGQNEIGPDLYEELAVIRTEETLRAGEILGAQVDFLNFSDFGFSKSATEAFRFWGGREEALRRLVFFIRKYKPDVLFTNHSTGGGHGHHQAVAVTAIAAFDAAADPNKFPDQLKIPGLSLWQPRKLYLRTFSSSGGRPDVTHRIEEIHKPSGGSYLEIAVKALREHKSQGMDGVNMSRFNAGGTMYRIGRTDSAYPADTASFLSGISIGNGDTMLSKFRSSLDSLSPGMPADDLTGISTRLLAEISRHLNDDLAVKERRLLSQWQEELEQLVIASSAIAIEITPDDSIVVAGQKTGVQVAVRSDKTKIELMNILFIPAGGWRVIDNSDEPKDNTRRFFMIPDSSASKTLPRLTQQYRSIEENDATILELEIRVNGHTVTLHRSITIDVAPAIEFTVTPEVAWLPAERMDQGVEFNYSIVNRFAHKVAGTIEANGSGSWHGSQESFLIEKEDGVAKGVIKVIPKAAVISDDRIQFVTSYASTVASVKPVGVRVSPGITLGIIRSYDTAIESFARILGIPYVMLDEPALASGDLSRFSSIVVDIRAYAVREDLRNNNTRLLEYVRKGGNLVVLYQKNQDWKAEYAPYPFELTRDRITDEEAPVTVLLPQHSLVTTPNLITQEDWSGWVQERGVYFPSQVSSEYQRVLSSHDPNEPPLDTGLIVARSGEGSYIFTSYVWYRQMKEANQGSLRMFANMLSYPLHRK